jgi:hypothetical protein
MPSNHSFYDSFRTPYIHAWPIVIFGGVVFFYFLIRAIWKRIMRKVEKVEAFPEDLTPFSKALGTEDRRIIISEEENCRESCGIKILSDEALERVRDKKYDGEKKYIENLCTYDILAHPIYKTEFQYFMVYERDLESDEVKFSDRIKKIIYLYFLTPSQLESFSFSYKIRSSIKEGFARFRMKLERELE